MEKVNENVTSRKEFLKKGLFGIGSLLLGSELLSACSTVANTTGSTGNVVSSEGSCTLAPSETKGPFPIKSPAEQVKSNIVSDRAGIAMVMKIKVQNANDNCKPLQGVLVDVWHCDKDGNYSEYGGMQMQQTDYTNAHFLRGRQTTDANGEVTFISIYPGWYRGRAPHVHLEVLSSSGSSLVVSQIAFPEDTSSQVYSSSLYASHGQFDTSNSRDNVFNDSLALNMGVVTGNVNDGYTLTKTIVVNA